MVRNNNTYGLFTEDIALGNRFAIIFAFLGESIDVFHDASANCSSYNAIFIDVRVAMQPSIVKQCRKLNLPIVFIKDDTELKGVESHKDMVAYTIDQNITHSTIMYILYRCQLSHENLPSQVTGGKGNQELFRSLVGSSDGIHAVHSAITKVASTDMTVLILGESGTGKEVVARNLHYYSARVRKPFVAINCGAIPRDLLESELFGHEKGAFTGAHTNRKGKFEAADGGTIFLDEIGDMPKDMQVKLLRIIQERQFQKVGGNKNVSVDVRIIAATHQDLEKLIAVGKFREDLYYRLNVFPIEVPPLRARIEDLPLLISEILARLSAQGLSIVKLLDETMLCLSQYDWPGNVRELVNLMERLCVLYPGALIGVAELPKKFQANPIPVDKKILTEQEIIQQAMVAANGDLEQVAAALHLRKNSLLDKISKYGIKS